MNDSPPLHEEMSKEERRLFTGGSKGAGESRLVSNQSDVFFFGENRNREDHRRGSRRSNFYKTCIFSFSTLISVYFVLEYAHRFSFSRFLFHVYFYRAILIEVKGSM